MTPFSEAIAALKPEADGYTVQPDENWGQGRTVFGGLVAAFAVEAARRAFPDLPSLRSAQFTLAGPAQGVLHVRPELIRSGKSTTFIGVDVRANGGIVMRAVLTFGQARPSRHALNLLRAEPFQGPEGGFSLFDSPGAPRNTVNFEGRLVGGHAPFSGAAVPALEMWLRHRETGAVSADVALTALADASPPAVFPLFSAPAPISTVTWTVDFCGADVSPSGWFFARTTSGFVQDGFSFQTTEMYDAAGRPVLVGRQLVALYD